MAEPVAIDPDEGAGFITWWFCDPPPKGTTFRCLRDQWATVDGTPVRSIYEIEQLTQ